MYSKPNIHGISISIHMVMVYPDSKLVQDWHISVIYKNCKTTSVWGWESVLYISYYFSVEIHCENQFISYFKLDNYIVVVKELYAEITALLTSAALQEYQNTQKVYKTLSLFSTCA